MMSGLYARLEERQKRVDDRLNRFEQPPPEDDDELLASLA
jgi:hypothetical protein